MGTNRDERPPTLLQQAEVLGLIGEVIAPFTGDLEQVSNKLWVRRLSDEHWGLLEIAPWKGASHSLTYGGVLQLGAAHREPGMALASHDQTERPATRNIRWTLLKAA